MPISGPLLPAHEFSILTARFVPSELSKLLWVNDGDFSTSLVASLKSNIKTWAAELPFKPIDRQKLAGSAISSTTAVIEPVNYNLRVVLFRDRLSGYRCQQLVLIQEGWLRVALPSATAPVAEQYNARAWLSIFYYDAPVPGQIMSINFFPVAGHSKELFLDEPLVMNLLAHNLIQRRPAEYVSPWPDGFPELPQ
ncbi:MAG TPA: hypothetical protein PLM07_13845 [Candidatus Rifleibacterium sp.]|nr:hypothetical protein [Candidatus Rifleibacterium sp.]HPT46969.1 hypothetical protein [Candidatus Rifleibacterium sp.]